MDELEISGKRYISSRRAAREHKYHSDYIGQLIRSGKVVGQKVGRSWYVDAQSLESYLQGETNLVQAVSEVSEEKELITPALVQEETPEKIDLPEPEPEPVEKIVQPIIEEPLPIRIVKEEETRIPIHISKPAASRGLTYMTDDAPLLPEIRKEEVQNNFETKYSSPVSQKPVKSRGGRGVLAMGMLGIVSFLLSVGVASFLSYEAVVEGEGSTAAVVLGYWE